MATGYGACVRCGSRWEIAGCGVLEGHELVRSDQGCAQVGCGQAGGHGTVGVSSPELGEGEETSALVVPGLLSGVPAERYRCSSIVEGRVTAYVGQLGAGKSYVAVRRAHKVLHAGGRVATNFALEPMMSGKYAAGAGSELLHFASLDDLLEMEDCLVVADEAHMLTPSWDPKAMRLSHRFFMTHARKFGVEIAFVVQDEDRITRMCRDLIHFTSHLRRWFIPFVGLTFEMATVPYGRPRKEGWREWVRFDLDLAKSYNTRDIISPSAGDPLEVALCREMARRRMVGEPVSGVVEAVRELFEVEASPGGHNRRSG